MTSGRGTALGQGGEAAQIGEQQRGLDGLAAPAPQRAREHPRGAAPAEIGLEGRGQRRSRGQRGERRCGEARRLAEAGGFLGGEGTGPDPGQGRAVRPPPDRVLMDGLRAKSFKPGPPCVACGRGRQPSGQEPQRLDHLAAIGPPEPAAPGDQRVRRGQRERPGRERSAVLDQALGEVRQKTLRRRRFSRRVDQPGEG